MTRAVVSKASPHLGATARLAAAFALAASIGTGWVNLTAQTTPPPTGRSFLVLDPDADGNPRSPARFTQELFATTQLDAFAGDVAKVLGGVAFAPNGDVWASECLSHHTTLHRYARNQYRSVTPTAANHMTITPRVELAQVQTDAGCGIVNHPDGAIYSNTDLGVTRLNASTGLPIPWPNGSTGPVGAGGNALGIVVDPQTLHIVYADADCDDKPLGSSPAFCTLFEVDPGTALTPPSTSVFAQLPHSEMPFVDGIYFEPTGDHLFVTNRVDVVYEAPGFVPGEPQEVAINHVTVLRRPSLVTSSAPQVVRHLPMPTEPDGIAFHPTGQFLVTNDEEGGTMTRFDFPNGFGEAPINTREITVYDESGDEVPLTVYGSPFAAGGFRGDLSQVGPDGCLYATQGRDFNVTDFGTRYDNNDVTTEDSIVRICPTAGNGGFEPPPGVRQSDIASIAGSAYLDVDGDNVISSGDELLDNVSVTLTRLGATSETATTSGDTVPTYGFDGLVAGDYEVNAPSTVQGYAIAASTPGTVSVALADGENRTGVDFLYKPGKLAGSVYFDANDDGSITVGDTFLSGVPITLSSGAATASGAGSTPTYTFPGLPSGPYSVTAPATMSGYLRTVAPSPVTLGAGQFINGLDFLYVGGRLSGYAYVDANGNLSMDSGETRLQGVTMTGPNGDTRTTDFYGYYEFTTLAAAAHAVSAPAAFGIYTRNTAATLPAPLGPGGNIPNLNFGYVAPAPPVPGSISGVAYIDADADGIFDVGETKLSNVSIALSGLATASASTTTAGYTFANLASGGYGVSSAPTTTYNGFTYNLTTLSPIGVSLAAGEHLQNVNFGYRIAVAYATYTQGGWGAPPAGNNPGMLLQTHFSSVYPTGVAIGIAGVSGKHSLKFTSSTAIRNFLPTGGAPKALKASATNPTTSGAGVFAGQVLAVKLAVDFSAAGKTTQGLGALKIASGYVLAGSTVNQVLALANQALGGGGLPPGVSFSMLNDVMTRINENFDNGTTNNGFLVQ